MHTLYPNSSVGSLIWESLYQSPLWNSLASKCEASLITLGIEMLPSPFPISQLDVMNLMIYAEKQIDNSLIANISIHVIKHGQWIYVFFFKSTGVNEGHQRVTIIN